MKFRTQLKKAAVAAMVIAGSLFAADATIGGNIPLSSTVIIYPEQRIDFSVAATLQKIASIHINNNAPGFKIHISFNNDDIAFSDGNSGTTNIFTNLAFSSASTNWGTGLAAAGIDETADWVAASGDCSDPHGDLTSGTAIPGAIPGCLSTSSGTSYTANDVIALDDGSSGYATQTSATADAVINLKGSWNAGTDNTGSTHLMAGTYSLVMTVVIESDY